MLRLQDDETELVEFDGDCEQLYLNSLTDYRMTTRAIPTAYFPQRSLQLRRKGIPIVFFLTAT